jgi:hypothetical protein
MKRPDSKGKAVFPMARWRVKKLRAGAPATNTSNPGIKKSHGGLIGRSSWTTNGDQIAQLEVNGSVWNA